MLRLLIVSAAVLFSFNAMAEQADIEAMDAAARSAQGSSVMFKAQNPQEAMARVKKKSDADKLMKSTCVVRKRLAARSKCAKWKKNAAKPCDRLICLATA